jgi:hypothetical protein
MSNTEPKREGSESIDVSINGITKDIQWKNATIVNVLARYIASQPFTNVLLCIGIGGFYWAVWYALTTAIPDDRKMIQSIIKDVQDTDKEERQKDRIQYDSWFRYIADQVGNGSANSKHRENVGTPKAIGGFSSRER